MKAPLACNTTVYICWGEQRQLDSLHPPAFMLHFLSYFWSSSSLFLFFLLVCTRYFHTFEVLTLDRCHHIHASDLLTLNFFSSQKIFLVGERRPCWAAWQGPSRWADVGAFKSRFAHLLRRVDIIIFISLDAEFNYLHPRFYFVKMCPRVRALEPFKARHVLRCSSLTL